ncbi:MAG: methyltransferase domain-containing protein [Mastigocoleus sp.]
MKLHIGGNKPHAEWKILDIESRPDVDIVGNASNLKEFADNSVEAIYASHVLEHFFYGLDNELLNTLAEWYRVLQPTGNLYISVPNLETLCWLYLHPSLAPMEKHHIMRIMFGGQTNQHDVHKVGFDFDILSLYLEEVGFNQYHAVPEFNMFDDCSSLKILNTLISLNVLATK